MTLKRTRNAARNCCFNDSAKSYMNAAIRAHRILISMPGYKTLGDTDDWPLNWSSADPGDPIGRYRNSDVAEDVIGIFTDGMVWLDDNRMIALRFSDISAVGLVNGKESMALLLKVHDGRQLRLPVKGRRGQFFDSMEMLRFLDSVVQDLHRAAAVVERGGEQATP